MLFPLCNTLPLVLHGSAFSALFQCHLLREGFPDHPTSAGPAICLVCFLPSLRGTPALPWPCFFAFICLTLLKSSWWQELWSLFLVNNKETNKNNPKQPTLFIYLEQLWVCKKLSRKYRDFPHTPSCPPFPKRLLLLTSSVGWHICYNW